MRILITRPAADAAPVAELLRERGADVVMEPLLTIEPRPATLPDLDKVQALLFTSANGVRAFAEQSPRRDVPAYAVGDGTAEVARQSGFEQVRSAAGDVSTLAQAVVAACRPDAGPLLHVAGTVSAGDLAGALAEAGFTVERVVLYEAVPAGALGSGTAAAISAHEIDGALFFSPRTARQFLRLVEEAGMRPELAHVQAYALSPAVADELGTAGFKQIVTAQTPTLQALIAAFDHEPPVSSPGETPAVDRSPAADAADAPLQTEIDDPRSEPFAGAPSPPLPWPKDPAPDPAPAEASVESPPAAVTAPPAGKSALAKDPAVTPPKLARIAAPASARPRRSGAAGWLALLLLIVLAGVGTAPWWSPSVLALLPWAAIPPRSAAAQANTAALAARVSGLEQATAPLAARLDAVERQLSAVQSAASQRVAAAAPATPSVTPSAPPPVASASTIDGAAISLRLDGLSTRLDRLEPAVAAASSAAVVGTARLAEQVRPLEGRVAAVEQGSSAFAPKLDALASRLDALSSRTEALGGRLDGLDRSSRAAAGARLVDAVIPAAAAVRAAVAAGTPFSGPLAIVARDASAPPLAQAAAVTGPALGVLQPLAERGVEPLRQLRADFPVLSDALRAANRPAGDGPGNWWSEASRSLASLVTVTRLDQGAPGLDGIVATASAALARDDLAAAATALRALGEPAATVVRPWLARADARLKASDAAEALVAAVGRAALASPPPPAATAAP